MTKNKHLKIFIAEAKDDQEYLNKITESLKEKSYDITTRDDISSNEYQELMLLGDKKYGAIITSITNDKQHKTIPSVTYNMMDNITLEEHVDSLETKLNALGISPDSSIATSEQGYGGTVKDIKQQKIPNALY